MAPDRKAPRLGAPVRAAFIGWGLKKDGEAVKKDDILVMLETDKANVELRGEQAGMRGEQAGTLKIVRKDGAVKVGELIARIDDAAGAAAKGDGGAAKAEGAKPE